MDASKSDNSDKRSKQIRTRKMGVTPLHESLVYGSKEQVRTLLQSGASVGKLSGEDKMFKIFRLLQNVVDSVVSLSELKI